MGKVPSQITGSASPLFTQPFIRAQIKETSKPRATGLCAGKSPGTGEFPAQMASNAENVSIWWRLHDQVKAKGSYNTSIDFVLSTFHKNTIKGEAKFSNISILVPFATKRFYMNVK